jgi:hypothetical protein
MQPKVTNLAEIHRGGQHLVTCTFEVDVAEAPRLIHSFDVSGIPPAQLDHLIATAEEVDRARAIEMDAVTAAAADGGETNGGEENTPE